MKKLNRRKFLKRISFAVISLLVIDMFWFEKYMIEWNYFDLSTSKTKIKVVQLSDLHLQSVKSFHKNIAEKINKMQPEVICITGDAIDDNTKIKDLNLFLKLIDNSIKKYAILGNWEYWGNINLSSLNSVYKTNNCKLLVNETVLFTKENRTINIVGLDDFVGGQANIKKSISNLDIKNESLILNHCPQYFSEILKVENQLNSKLVLSGHTHGGQITFLGIVPFKPQGSGKYLKSFYGNKLKMYVSKGIGTSILPIRFGSRAEVAVFDI